jgi:hypothetical protein
VRLRLIVSGTDRRFRVYLWIKVATDAAMFSPRDAVRVTDAWTPSRR